MNKPLIHCQIHLNLVCPCSYKWGVSGKKKKKKEYQVSPKMKEISFGKVGDTTKVQNFKPNFFSPILSFLGIKSNTQILDFVLCAFFLFFRNLKKKCKEKKEGSFLLAKPQGYGQNLVNLFNFYYFFILYWGIQCFPVEFEC